jgi:hypothetical protein
LAAFGRTRTRAYTTADAQFLTSTSEGSIDELKGFLGRDELWRICAEFILFLL